MNKSAFVVIALVLLGAVGFAQTEFQRAPSERLVTVTNFPNPQNVAGTVNVGNLPGTQNVAGTVNVGNLPEASDPASPPETY